MRVEGGALPLRFTDRGPWSPAHRDGGPAGRVHPDVGLKGADAGPLAGKTVALKDHIALAGVRSRSART